MKYDDKGFIIHIADRTVEEWIDKLQSIKEEHGSRSLIWPDNEYGSFFIVPEKYLND